MREKGRSHQHNKDNLVEEERKTKPPLILSPL